MKRVFISLFLVLLAAIPLLAQNNTTGSFMIKGQVMDSLTNESVPYATLKIMLASAPQQPIKLLACDDDGKFETSLTTSGEYLIQMQSIGKHPAQKSFTLSDGNPTLNLGQLYMLDDDQLLNEVTVTAQKPLVKVEIDKITYSLEDDPEATTNNMLDMLKKVPMVTVDGEDKIQLKGSSNFKIYMNGKPSNLLSNNPSDVLKSMPANSVKNIEVITDPGSKYDAEGVGGIINIITTGKSLEGFQGNVSARVNSFGGFGGSGYITTKVGKLGLTANYSYNKNQSPWNDSESSRENLLNDTEKYLNQNGRSKYSGPFQFGYLEASYEIDTLNLISVGANLFNGRMKNKSEMHADMFDNGMHPTYSYDRFMETKSTFGSTDINVDYQHSTSLKDELFTLSYRFSNSPDGSENYTQIDNLIVSEDFDGQRPWSRYPERTDNDAWTAEHTGQVDYTRPIFGNQTIEAGVKYIFRQSNSETDRERLNELTNIWEDTSQEDSYFKHTQHIYSGYLGWALKLTKFGFKAGVRAEGTSLDVAFKRVPEKNFDTNYFDIVPNATISYQIDMSNQIRLGYNMRIQRPGIWYLNPYVNNTDPTNISYGNPNLDSEKSNSVNLNYSRFTQKFNMNASLSYSFVDNAIERYTFIDPDLPNIYQSTYGNVGKRQSVGGFLYGSWNPVPAFRLYVNGGANYTTMESTALNLKSEGWNGRLFGGAQFTLPKDFRINLNGGYMSKRITLQGEYGDMYFMGLNFSKDFLKKKLTVSVNAQEPFRKNMKFESKSSDISFIERSLNYNTARNFGISVSYRFGSMKSQIQKVRRGISNDDMKAGESGSGGGGQETPM